jgi:methylenetetrahydrofolate reductase (NADPH)
MSAGAIRSFEGRAAEVALHRAIAELARDASIEINAPEIKHLAACRSCLPAGKRMYVSHLPKQSWDETIAATREVRAAGFVPIPHVPVRLLSSRDDAIRLIAALAEHTTELLLISGDYGKPSGPYAATIDLMQTGLLQQHGVGSLSFAGHPEGHPCVALDAIRRAEVDKARWSDEAVMPSRIVTQFFFESTPFIQWTESLRIAGVRSAIIAGVAGPASIAKLVRFAVRCGVGRSISALSHRPNVMTKLLDEHGPETLLAELAQARLDGRAHFDGIHVFGFGGFLRTCEWLQRVAAGNFDFDR